MSGRTPQQAYLDLQNLARAQGRNTQQLFELYIHERFLARLAESRFSEMLVLKGGMLLAVLEVRRPRATRTCSHEDWLTMRRIFVQWSPRSPRSRWRTA